MKAPNAKMVFITPIAALVQYIPPKAVAVAVGKMFTTMCTAINRQTNGLNHLRGNALLVCPAAGSTTRGAVRKSAMKTITKSAIKVTSGIMFKN